MSSFQAKTVTARDFGGKTYRVEANKLTWRPSAYGFVIKDGKLLLLRQTNGHDLPGGGVDLGETPEEAVIREIKEETGLDAANPRLLTVKTSFYKNDMTKEHFVQSVMIYYQCDFLGGKLSTDGFDEFEQVYAEAPEWLPIDKLDDITIGTSIDFRDFLPQ